MQPSRVLAALLAALFTAGCAGSSWAIEEMWRREPRLTDPPSDYAMNSVIVIPWTDDNGDGRIDESDGGDVLYVGTRSRTLGEGAIRLLDGRTGQDLWLFERPPLLAGVSVALAAGDVDGDGFPELVAGSATENSRWVTLMMYNWDGTLRWIRNDSTLYSEGMLKRITLADLDGDGFSEILASNTIVDKDGVLVRTLQVPPCLESYPIDVDLDGVLEIACGTSVARQDGSVVFSLGDGPMTMVPVEWDGDPFPEFAVSGWGNRSIRIIQHDGTLLVEDETDWQSYPNMPFVAGDADCDGRSEVHLGEEYPPTRERTMTSYGPLLEPRWRVPSDDGAAVNTGSLAWIEGRAAYLHHDETRFLALDARDGSEIFTLPILSVTAQEVPVFADLDGDGIGELVTNSSFGTEPSVQAWRDPTWCPARAVFNQYAYVPDFIGYDLRPTGPPAVPIDWARVGFRQQRNDCPCRDPPIVTIDWQPDCTPGMGCAEAIIAPARSARLTWTLPDGSSSTEQRPCFAHVPGGVVTVQVLDCLNCLVEESILLPPLEDRSVSVVVEPECADPATQCARAVTTAMVDPLMLAWTLPDGSSSSEPEPCFPVTSDGTVSVNVTDAMGCILSDLANVAPHVPPVLVELSPRGSPDPLRVRKVSGGIEVTWEASPSGQPMGLWSADVGAWASREPIACSVPGRAIDTRVVTAAHYLAGELDCSGASGPLGESSLGVPRAMPVSSCW